MISLAILAFVSGILTVLAPCVLPLLPIIIGSSVTSKDKKKPYLVTLGLVISITLFTILLKASTAFINIDPIIWKYISGGIIVIFGIIYLFPNLWNNLSDRLNLQSKSDNTLNKASENNSVLGSMLIGASLGPVFASCSPTYALIIATVLPVNFFEGLVYIIIYAIGLALVMLGIAIFGRALINKLKVFSNPNGWFKKSMGIIFLLVGLSIISGFDKKIETAVINSSSFDVTKIEQGLLDTFMPKKNSSAITQSTPIKKAPEIIGISDWINSPKLDLASLKGKVVLVDFWTYSCINCQRTLPYVTKWYDTYKDQGLVVLGVHAPEFSFEKNVENVRKAVVENKINYPVALDNDFKTWNNYSNQFWPAHYLIDKDGNIVYTHFGEGKYTETENKIRELIALKPMNNPQPEKQKSSQLLTPEAYIGTARRDNPTLQLTGNWNQQSEDVEALEDGATLNINFSAKELYIVAQATNPTNIEVLVNGQPQYAGSDVNANGIATIQDAKLYKLVKSDNFLTKNQLTIKANKGAKLNVFTFGD